MKKDERLKNIFESYGECFVKEEFEPDVYSDDEEDNMDILGNDEYNPDSEEPDDLDKAPNHPSNVAMYRNRPDNSPTDEVLNYLIPMLYNKEYDSNDIFNYDGEFASLIQSAEDADELKELCTDNADMLNDVDPDEVDWDIVYSIIHQNMDAFPVENNEEEMEDNPTEDEETEIPEDEEEVEEDDYDDIGSMDNEEEEDENLGG